MGSRRIEAVERALTVLRCFDARLPTASLAQLADRTGINKATLLRVLVTLEDDGFVRRLEGGRYRLGPELLRLGSLYQESFNLVDFARPVLTSLVHQTNESAALYIRDGDSRICLCRAEPTRSVRHHLLEGRRLPLGQGAAGKVLLAFSGDGGAPFETIRKTKVHVTSGERDPEATAVCAPVFATEERLIGALQASGPSMRFDAETIARTKSIVLDHAQTLTVALGGEPTLLFPDSPRCVNA